MPSAVTEKKERLSGRLVYLDAMEKSVLTDVLQLFTLQGKCAQKKESKNIFQAVAYHKIIILLKLCLVKNIERFPTREDEGFLLLPMPI